MKLRLLVAGLNPDNLPIVQASTKTNLLFLTELGKQTIFFFFFLSALCAYLYSIFCERRIRDPAPGRMRYSYIFIASALRV